MTTVLLSIVLQVLALHPAGNPDGKILTMPQAVSGMGVSPKSKAYHWEGGHELVEGNGKRTRPRKYILPKEDKEGIVIGQSVSRNEFGINGGVFPSPSGKLLAVYRKDESAVTQFPLLDITTRTGSLVPIRYPMNGMA